MSDPSELPQGIKSKILFRQAAQHLLARMRPVFAIVATIGAIGAVLSGLTGYWTSFKTISNELFQAKSTDKAATILPAMATAHDRASIAVFPFKARSSADADKQFADGLADDLISALAKNKDIFVVGRQSVAAVSGPTTEFHDIRRKLGVAYILQGDVRRLDGAFQLKATLLDAKNGDLIWTEDYEGQVNQLFDAQREIVTRIAGVLLSQVRAAEVRSGFKQPTDKMQAYDLRKRARALQLSFNKANVKPSRDALEQAIAIDPTYADAWITLGHGYVLDYALGISGEATRDSLAHGIELIRKGIQLRPDIGQGFTSLSYGLQFYGDVGGAVLASRKAVSLSPSDSDAWIMFARALTFAGSAKEGVAAADRAAQLNPLGPAYNLQMAGLARYAIGDIEAARALFAECVTVNPSFIQCYRELGLAQDKLGLEQDACKNIAEYLKRRPDFTLKTAQIGLPFQDKTLADQVSNTLRRCGVPS